MAEFRPDEIKWVAIVEEITRRIASGELAPGDKVPSALQIMAEWSVSRGTADRVMDALKTSGLVYTVVGKGTFVASPEKEGE